MATQEIFNKLNNDGYSFRQLTYPQDLGDENSGNGHFVFFAINETKGATLSSSISRPTGESGIPLTSNIENAPVAGDRAINYQNIFGFSGSNMTTRIADSIALYMPESVTTTSSTNWEFGDITAAVRIENVAQLANDIISNYDDPDTIQKFINKEHNFNAFKDQAMTFGLDFASTFLPGFDLQNATQSLRKQFRNPYLEFLFKGVNGRTFQMEFKFFPKNETEAFRVRDIERTFKKHHLPEYYRANSFGQFLLYPSTFDIFFFSNTTENKFLHKMSTCVLSEVAINYTGGGQWSTHREIAGEGSPPTNTTMTLTFQELELMTKQRAEQGF